LSTSLIAFEEKRSRQAASETTYLARFDRKFFIGLTSLLTRKTQPKTPKRDPIFLKEGGGKASIIAWLPSSALRSPKMNHRANRPKNTNNRLQKEYEEKERRK